jgi:hypothetical protein
MIRLDQRELRHLYIGSAFCTIFSLVRRELDLDAAAAAAAADVAAASVADVDDDDASPLGFSSAILLSKRCRMTIARTCDTNLPRT